MYVCITAWEDHFEAFCGFELSHLVNTTSLISIMAEALYLKKPSHPSYSVNNCSCDSCSPEIYSRSNVRVTAYMDGIQT